MTLQNISLGTGPDTPGADSLYLAFTKANANFADLYGGTPTSTKTGSYTLALTDAQSTVEMNLTTSNNVTVPTNASVAFPLNTSIEVCQVGTGQTTIVAAGGVTIRTSGTLVLRTQWSSVALRKRATDEWVLSGDTV